MKKLEGQMKDREKTERFGRNGLHVRQIYW